MIDNLEVESATLLVREREGKEPVKKGENTNGMTGRKRRRIKWAARKGERQGWKAGLSPRMASSRPSWTEYW